MNKTAPIKVRQNAKKFGLTFWVLILAALLAGGTGWLTLRRRRAQS
jgi:hypothetical protein